MNEERRRELRYLAERKTALTDNDVDELRRLAAEALDCIDSLLEDLEDAEGW